MRRWRAAAAGAVILVTAACGPPPPPPPSSSTWDTGLMVHEARDANNAAVLCRAIAEVGIVLRGTTALRVYSDVRVAGPGAPDAPCIYQVWAFGLTLTCEDGSQFGCGSWRLDTPNGDIRTAAADHVFRHVPEDARLTVTFTATWGFSANHQGSLRSPVIRCDATRCRFYPEG